MLRLTIFVGALAVANASYPRAPPPAPFPPPGPAPSPPPTNTTSPPPPFSVSEVLRVAWVANMEDWAAGNRVEDVTIITWCNHNLFSDSERGVMAGGGGIPSAAQLAGYRLFRSCQLVPSTNKNWLPGTCTLTLELDPSLGTNTAAEIITSKKSNAGQQLTFWQTAMKFRNGAPMDVKKDNIHLDGVSANVDFALSVVAPGTTPVKQPCPCVLESCGSFVAPATCADHVDNSWEHALPPPPTGTPSSVASPSPATSVASPPPATSVNSSVASPPPPLPVAVVEVTMKARGTIASYTSSIMSMIRDLFKKLMAAKGVQLAERLISVTAHGADNYYGRRLSEDGVVLVVQMDLDPANGAILPAGTDTTDLAVVAESVKSDLAKPETQAALKTSLTTIGVEVTEMAVTGTDSSTDSGLSGGALAGIVIGVLLAVLVAVGVFWKKKKLAGVVIPATKMATKESAAA